MNNNYKQKLLNYLNDTLGFNVSIEKLPDAKLRELPLYLRQSDFYYTMDIEDHKFLLLFSKNDTHKTALQLKKHFQIISKNLGMKVVALMDTQSPLFRKRLIQEKVNFIVPSGRLYLPELLIDLKESIPNVGIFSEFLSPSAQFLLLYHLQMEYLESFSFKEIAKKLGYSPKTITKIANELQMKDICKIDGTKEKRFVFEKNRWQLWRSVEKQMQSPVYKAFYVNNNELPLHLSATAALIYYSSMPFSEEQNVYAIYKPEFEKLKEENYWEYIDEVEGDMLIEVWKYNPKLLSRNRYVDLLSLYLYYRNDSNEMTKAKMSELLLKKTWD
ncbi:MAG: hypothetical protein LBH32_04455 [Dysgonamonadaceae bacterium]|jgi:hypothetical protein|nr:hypothetical protein [Dysgonamonadaceae bacterium]